MDDRTAVLNIMHIEWITALISKKNNELRYGNFRNEFYINKQ